jgi:NADPH-dependent curcumin reductase CurA
VGSAHPSKEQENKVSENRQIVIASLPEDALRETDFELRTVPVPEPSEGEVLCRTLAITIGAGQRAGLQGSASYAGAARADTLMAGNGVALVVESNDENFSPGDCVTGPTGWQDYAALAGRSLTKVNGSADPALHLGIMGTNGLTAYFGLLDVGRAKEGETVVVSAAAGSVGHTVGQIAKLKGCRVVGVAGSAAKCSIVVDELGFDAAVNYKSPDFRAAFKAATPDRIDVYFDNTGGDILGSALFRMNAHGRIVCCGVVSQYDTTKPGGGPRGVPGLLVNNRVRMEGFLVFDYARRFEEARKQLMSWIDGGELRPRVTEFGGLENAPNAFVELLAGGTVGTTIVRVSDDE